jgi:hypothetical protein
MHTASTVARVFDSASGHEICGLDCGPIAGYGGLCFDMESRRLAVFVYPRHYERAVFWWDLLDRDRSLHSRFIEGGTTFCELPANGPFVVVVRGKRTQLIDPWNDKPPIELVGPTMRAGPLYSVSADGKVFAAHTDANSVVFWDTECGRELAKCEVFSGTRQIALSARGSRLAMVSDRGFVAGARCVRLRSARTVAR